MISLYLNHDFQWARSELVIIYPDGIFMVYSVTNTVEFQVFNPGPSFGDAAA